MNDLQRYLKRIYGFDALTYGLLFLSVLLFAGFGLVPLETLHKYTLLGYLPLILAIFRIFSVNREQRTWENEHFVSLVAPLCERVVRRGEKRAQKKLYRFYKCPVCHESLRVPKGKGLVEITCPHCDHHFVKKS